MELSERSSAILWLTGQERMEFLIWNKAFPTDRKTQWIIKKILDFRRCNIVDLRGGYRFQGHFDSAQCDRVGVCVDVLP